LRPADFSQLTAATTAVKLKEERLTFHPDESLTGYPPNENGPLVSDGL